MLGCPGRFFLVALALFSVVAAPLCAQSNNATPERPRRARVNAPLQTRGRVMTRLGIVATSQTLASQAGAQILHDGGNAIDAAIAANAVLGLVEPTSNGLGGDLFAIVYEAKTGKLYGLNASGWAPAKLTIDFLESHGVHSMPQSGINSVTVPGVVAGWEMLRQRFGTRDFATLLAPAIYYAEQGFPVSERIAASWRASTRLLSSSLTASHTYLPDGRAPRAGEVFRNPDLAASLKLIAEKGRDGFYQGPIAEAIVAASKELGGTFELADLEEFQPEWVEPLSTTYRGWTVCELPPNGQGIAALSMLNIMETFPLAEYGAGSAKALHVMIEAKKLAYADLMHYVGDPRFSKIPVKEMLSKALAADRAKEIDPEHAKASVAASQLGDLGSKHGGDTIYMCTIDRDGNIVSLIQSNYAGFGSGVVPAGKGFMLQNRGALFTMERGHPNALAGHKRPLHTIIPAFMYKDDVHIGFGIMGGWNQAQAHAQFVADVVDFGMNIQAAMEAPRFTKMTFEGTDVQMEPRVPENVRAELAQRGHEIKLLPEPYSGTVGGGQAVMVDGKGVHSAASDPRKDGSAVPEAPVVK
jgi:gamma-glutamyltranspeptidase / glutathione hydrolase